jgi:hypothetical protein
MILLSAMSIGASAATIDFSSLTTPGTYNTITSTFVADGFQFQPNFGDLTSFIDSATETDPGLQHPSPGDMLALLLDVRGVTNGTTFSEVSGGTFTLNRIDLNWFDDYYAKQAHNWTLFGVFADGSAATLNGVLQPDTFVTETPNWSNLISVTVTGLSPGAGAMGIDNIDVTAAPLKPSIWANLIFGFLGLAWMLYRRKSGTLRLA